MTRGEAPGHKIHKVGCSGTQNWVEGHLPFLSSRMHPVRFGILGRWVVLAPAVYLYPSEIDREEQYVDTEEDSPARVSEAY